MVRHLVIMIGCSTALAVVIVSLSYRRLADLVTRRRDRALAEALIERARARPRPGMETADWRLINRAGARQWETSLRAQRRLRDRSEREVRGEVRDFRRLG